ncbi:MAG: hypothetical protein ABFS41_05755, partial [Myxococcota bacterium]
ASSLCAAAVLVLAFMAPQGMAQMLLLGVFGIVLTLFLAPAVAVTQDVVHPGLRALSYSLCVIVQHTAGDAWSPPLIGLLSDAMGLEKAVLFLPAYGVMAALLAAGVRCSSSKDTAPQICSSTSSGRCGASRA